MVGGQVQDNGLRVRDEGAAWAAIYIWYMFVRVSYMRREENQLYATAQAASLIPDA